MRTAYVIFFSLLLSLAVLLPTGCGGSDDDDSGDAAPATSEPAADSSPATNPSGTIQLAGTSWRALSVMDGPITIRPSSGQNVTLDFGSDGRVSGSTGCNSFSGRFSQSGNRVTIDNLATTTIGCPDEIAGLENAVLEALSVSGTISRVDDQLAVLQNEDGSIQLQRR